MRIDWDMLDEMDEQDAVARLGKRMGKSADGEWDEDDYLHEKKQSRKRLHSLRREMKEYHEDE